MKKEDETNGEKKTPTNYDEETTRQRIMYESEGLIRGTTREEYDK